MFENIEACQRHKRKKREKKAKLCEALGLGVLSAFGTLL
jgi:hypothetical protein